MCKRLLFFYFLGFFIFTIFFIVNNKLVEYGFLMKENVVYFKSFKFWNIIESFFLIGLLFPIIEEFGFRAFLTNDKNLERLGFSFFIIILIIEFINYFMMLNIWIYLIMVIIGVSIIFINSKLINCFTGIISKDILTYSILASLVFSFLHMGSNYSSDFIICLFFSVIPYFVNGLIYCRIRWKYGLVYSIILHVLHNFTVLLLNLILK